MPTYQYQCEDCEHAFEEFQSMTSDPVYTCPECEGSVKRLISGGGGFLFRGDGFYTTDYRSESYKKSEKADNDSSAGSKDKDSSKKDTSKSESKKTDSSTSSASESSD
ncbi:MAG: FmdB family zinc ribbon protein [Gemmatimonadota bacterium]|nr:FmdB family zinc ribbon protein [Gemmatimonadota bacterium]